MLRSLEELNIINVQSIDKMNPFVVQQMPEMRNNILQGKRWNGIYIMSPKLLYCQLARAVSGTLI
jgi:hypothetical protein